MKEILEGIKENQRRLNSCPRHSFTIRIDRRKKTQLPEKDTQMFCYWRCANCGGYVEFVNKKYYELGLKHGECTTKKSTEDFSTN